MSIDTVERACKLADELVAKLVELDVVGPFDNRRNETRLKRAFEDAFFAGVSFARDGGK